jgi:hypothetical protein
MNNFRDWTPEMVAAHNARISKSTITSHAHPETVHPARQPAVQERDLRDGPIPAMEIQEGISEGLYELAQKIWSLTGTGFGVLSRDKKKALYFVLIIDCRERLIDEDNLEEKWLVDCLRYAKKIPQDDPATCKIFTTQLKVTKPDVGIRVEIIEL